MSAPPPSTGNRPYWPGQIRASASSLETFANCPLQYTLGYVLGIDTPAGVQAAVGTLVHNVLERFLDPVNPVERTRERLTEILDDEWDDALFTYRAQASEYRTRVEDMLETWFEHEGRHADSVAKVEHHFRIDVAGHVLSGYIDRIDRSVPPGRTEADAELEVIDYKTGSWKNARAGEESLQLGTYHLAASRDPELVALGRPTKLRLHFLQVGKNAWQTVGPNHAAVWEALITNLLRDIETGRDEPSPEADCEYCDFHRVCPIQPQGRLVPIRPATAVKNSVRP